VATVPKKILTDDGPRKEGDTVFALDDYAPTASSGTRTVVASSADTGLDRGAFVGNPAGNVDKASYGNFVVCVGNIPAMNANGGRFLTLQPSYPEDATRTPGIFQDQSWSASVVRTNREDCGTSCGDTIRGKKGVKKTAGNSEDDEGEWTATQDRRLMEDEEVGVNYYADYNNTPHTNVTMVIHGSQLNPEVYYSSKVSLARTTCEEARKGYSWDPTNWVKGQTGVKNYWLRKGEFGQAVDENGEVTSLNYTLNLPHDFEPGTYEVCFCDGETDDDNSDDNDDNSTFADSDHPNIFHNIRDIKAKAFSSKRDNNVADKFLHGPDEFAWMLANDLLPYAKDDGTFAFGYQATGWGAEYDDGEESRWGGEFSGKVRGNNKLGGATDVNMYMYHMFNIDYTDYTEVRHTFEKLTKHLMLPFWGMYLRLFTEKVDYFAKVGETDAYTDFLDLAYLMQCEEKQPNHTTHQELNDTMHDAMDKLGKWSPCTPDCNPGGCGIFFWGIGTEGNIPGYDDLYHMVSQSNMTIADALWVAAIVTQQEAPSLEDQAHLGMNLSNIFTGFSDGNIYYEHPDGGFNVTVNGTIMTGPNGEWRTYDEMFKPIKTKFDPRHADVRPSQFSSFREFWAFLDRTIAYWPRDGSGSCNNPYAYHATAGQLHVTARAQVGQTYVVGAKEDEKRSIEVIGHELCDETDRIMLVNCHDQCGKAPSSSKVAYPFGQWSASSNYFTPTPFGPTTESDDPFDVEFHFDEQPARYCHEHPLGAGELTLPLGAGEMYASHRCDAKCEGQVKCVGDNCFCSGSLGSDKNDAIVSGAVCLPRYECEHLCAMMGPACHSINMHNTLPRCFINTGGCEGAHDDELGLNMDYTLLTKKAMADAPPAAEYDPKRHPSEVDWMQSGNYRVTNELVPKSGASKETVLRFAPMSLPSMGTYKVCFCDIELLPDGKNACKDASDYRVEIGKVHVSGLSSLLSIPKLRTQQCFEQYHGGLRCENEPLHTLDPQREGEYKPGKWPTPPPTPSPPTPPPTPDDSTP